MPPETLKKTLQDDIINSLFPPELRDRYRYAKQILFGGTVNKKEYKLDDHLNQCKPELVKLDKENKDWLNARPVGNEV